MEIHAWQANSQKCLPWHFHFPSTSTKLPLLVVGKISEQGITSENQLPQINSLSNDILFPQGLTSRDTPSPVDPDTVEVLMTFEPDPADLALSSIPGHETFDPRRHRFSEEELKPQPIMKKARKIQVPEEQKVSTTRCGPQLGLGQAHSQGWSFPQAGLSFSGMSSQALQACSQR